MEPAYVITAFGVFAALVGVIFSIMWKEIVRNREKIHDLAQMESAAKLALRLLEMLEKK